MNALYETEGGPSATPSALVMVLNGWIDAGSAAQQVALRLRERDGVRRLLTFSADELLDHRARRPIAHVVDGVNTGLTWPSLELLEIPDDDGVPFLLLHGPEPDRAWHQFAAEIVALAEAWDCPTILGAGAYPAAVPHTRDARLSVVANSSALAESLVGYVRGTIDVPAGVQAVIEKVAADRSLDAIGVWAQVPHYASSLTYHPGSQSLLRGVSEIGRLALDSDVFADDAEETRSKIERLVGDSAEQRDLLTQLEAAFDAESGPHGLTGQLPSGDELADSFQAFLRTQDPDLG